MDVVEKARCVVGGASHGEGEHQGNEENSGRIVPVEKLKTVVLNTFVSVRPGAPADGAGDHHQKRDLHRMRNKHKFTPPASACAAEITDCNGDEAILVIAAGAYSHGSEICQELAEIMMGVSMLLRLLWVSRAVFLYNPRERERCAANPSLQSSEARTWTSPRFMTRFQNREKPSLARASISASEERAQTRRWRRVFAGRMSLWSRKWETICLGRRLSRISNRRESMPRM